MDPKVILIVCRDNVRDIYERAIRAALQKERVDHLFVHKPSSALAIAHVDETGFPDFIFAEMGAGGPDAAVALLRHVRHAGKTMPIVLWEATFPSHMAQLIANLNGITVAWSEPNGLYRLGRYAVMLLRGPHHAIAS